MNIDEYAALDATGMAEVIASGEVTADEIAAIATKAITAVDDKINAVATGPFDRPLEYAPDGRFAGVPFAIKDLVCHAAGVPTRMGTRMLGDGIRPPADTHLMERFRAAGLATLAVTTTPEFGFNANTEAVTYGSTRNPWNLDYSAGGSSGGSAALVASGAIPIAHANDGGGSVRIPAGCNGLVGLKPSRGRIPMGPDMGDALSGFAIEFAVTRSVRDTAALLDDVAVSYPGDRFVIAPPSRPWAEEVNADPGSLRIAVHAESWADTYVDPEVAAAVDSVASTLEAAGHRVDRATPIFDWQQLLDAHVVIWSAFLAESVAGIEAMTGIVAGPDNLERTTWECVQYGRRVTAVQLGMANAIINTVSREVGRFFTEYDVLLTPTSNSPSVPLGQLNADAELTAEEWTKQIFDTCSFTPLFNATGTPAISLPLAQSSRGLPIGLQFAGPMCSESLLLRLASQLEQALPWADRRPGVHVTSL
ncbi:amidase [Rhodococcus sp. 27YEA15]|uniref:amidase n=1 Tax=Rhodococcus sp. 27YEA15 TaxID=3156259 RepID=UPI003C7ACE9D